MLRLLGIALSVGLADSLNPTTVGPALYLATARAGAVRVLQFTLGVFGVNLFAGLLLTIGPGRLLLDLVPRPEGTVRHVIELLAGALMITAAVGLWLGRRRLADRKLPGGGREGGSALILGASLAAVELPTAAAYFAVVAAIVASSVSVAQEVVVVVIYNLSFVLPLVAIAAVLLAAGDRADPLLQRAGSWLQRRWPVVLATLLLVVGGGLAIIGGAGLVKR